MTERPNLYGKKVIDFWEENRELYFKFDNGEVHLALSTTNPERFLNKKVQYIHLQEDVSLLRFLFVLVFTNKASLFLPANSINKQGEFLNKFRQTLIDRWSFLIGLTTKDFSIIEKTEEFFKVQVSLTNGDIYESHFGSRIISPTHFFMVRKNQVIEEIRVEFHYQRAYICAYKNSIPLFRLPTEFFLSDMNENGLPLKEKGELG